MKLVSRENPKVKRWVKLARDARLRRKEGRALVEGPHLVAAARELIKEVIVSEAGLSNREIAELAGRSPVVVSDSVFRAIVDAENPPGIAAEIAIPSDDKAEGDTVFLEGIQDPGNVGTIMRSAAAFGVGSVVLDRGCADPWSPKTLRAGMGAHFSLRIAAVTSLAKELSGFPGTVIATVPRGGVALSKAEFRRPVGWVFGAEGRGLAPETARRAKVLVTIPMTANAESLNVAAAAAICLYETFSRGAARS